MFLNSNYNPHPEQGTISIQDALAAGRKRIFKPGKIIMVSGTCLGFVLPFLGCSWWLFAILPLGSILLSYLHTLWVTPRWRIWAYAGVADIHQLQRAAELEGLLHRNSCMEIYGIASLKQNMILQQLQQRFLVDVPFIDDPDVAAVVNIYESSLRASDSRDLQLSIGATGIATEDGLYPWGEIWDEQVVYKSFGGRSRSRNGSSGNDKAFLTFYCNNHYIAIPILDLTITAGKLDNLLYIYRGRYERSKQ